MIETPSHVRISPNRYNHNAIVLLSGGLDSTAALHLAREQYGAVSAVALGYGQPHAIEVTAAQEICVRRHVPFMCLMIGEAVRGFDPIAPMRPGLVRPGVSRAVLPGRNLILIACAAAHGARLWPGQRFDVVMGANLDDSIGFADCRAEFVKRAGDAVYASLAGIADGSVRCPWVEMNFRKADIVGWCATRPDALADIRHSLSCYAGTRCGRCDACTLRAQAFAAHDLEDGTAIPNFPAVTRS